MLLAGDGEVCCCLGFEVRVCARTASRHVELLMAGDAAEWAGALLQKLAQGEVKALSQSILHYINNTVLIRASNKSLTQACTALPSQSQSVLNNTGAVVLLHLSSNFPFLKMISNMHQKEKQSEAVLVDCRFK